MKKSILLTSALLITIITATGYAEKITSSALMSPGCTQEEIKDIAGSALVSISKQQNWDTTHGYIIKLNEDKIKMGDLIMKMHKKGCFQNK